MHPLYLNQRVRVLAVRVIEASELIAADLFKEAEKSGNKVTLFDVEGHLARLANHPPGCECGRCELVTQVSAQGLPDRLPLAARGTPQEAARQPPGAVSRAG